MVNIGRKDVYWNYIATFLRIASSSILLPFILTKMPAEMVGIWVVFASISTFIILLDFGFNPSFARNVTYVFSGVKSLKTEGFESMSKVTEKTVDYGLLKGLIQSMKFFYLRVAVIALVLMLTLGTYYMYALLRNYQGSHMEIYACWVILSIITCYTLYTYYYDALVQGKGMIKRDKQINTIGQVIYLIISLILILFGFKIFALIIGQLISVIFVRICLRRTFFNEQMKKLLESSVAKPQKDILKVIYPNAVKVGLTSLGAVMVTRSGLVIGSLYLSLDMVASYGITYQLIAVITAISNIFIITYQPQIVNLRTVHDNKKIMKIYNKSRLIMLATFLFGGIVMILYGQDVLDLIGSKTTLMPAFIISIALFGALIESNVSMAGTLLLTKNFVPFFKASLISGAAIIIGLIIGLEFFSRSLLTLVLVPLIVTVIYQGWKWPYEAHVDLKK